MSRPSIVAMWLATALASTAPGQVSLSLEEFGVGGTYRPGDWTGIRVTVRNDGPEAEPLRIEWELPDADGDIATVSRRVVVAPGRSVTRWLYGRLLPGRFGGALDTEVFTLRAYAEQDGVRGEERAVARVSPATATIPSVGIAPTEGLIGLVGGGRLGLEAYDAPPSGLTSIPALNERTRIASAIGVDGLPDRWEGLRSYAAIVWAGDDPDTRPAALGLDEGRALLEWMHRGGTLVVVLPEAGNPWSLGSSANEDRHALASLLPETAPMLRDGVLVREMLPALSKRQALRDPGVRMPVRIFPEESRPAPWEPTLAFPSSRAAATGIPTPRPDTVEGEVFAIERPVGFGRLVLVGLDLDALRRRALQEGGLPDADCVWNPILGRRGDTLSAGEYAALDQSQPQRLRRRPTDVDSIGGGRLVADRIDLAGRAAVGVLAAMGIFATYWLLAGPLGFAILKRRGRQRWAWLAFVLTGAAFTGLAWVGSAFLREERVRVEHLTFLDHVARDADLDAALGRSPQRQRATSWFTASLPGYGIASISIADDAATTTAPPRNLLSTWFPPSGEERGRFPDTARYDAPLEAPGELDVPSRATAATFAADWMGTLPDSWGRLPWVDPDVPVETYLDPATGTVGISGRLLHGIPGGLEDVRVIHVNPYRMPLPRFAPGPLPIVADSGGMPFGGRFVILPRWPENAPLDLGGSLYPNGPVAARSTASGSLTAEIRGRYYDPFAASAGLFRPDSNLESAEEVVRRLDMLSLYGMLAPPPYLQNPPVGRDTVRIERIVGREVDLSAWFTRPCLIVIGYRRGSPLPVPVAIDGETPPSDGLTVVRWILPLPSPGSAAVPEPRPVPTASSAPSTSSTPSASETPPA
ncbi:MAG: hypothetical protein ACO3QA_04170 [Phycisphaerales bacterium]